MSNDSTDMKKQLASANGTTGVADPTLAFNVDPLSDFNVGMPVLDIMKMSRPWLATEEGRWGGDTFDAAANPGVLDENGWPTEIPDGLKSIGTLWDWAKQPLAEDSREGVYVVNYEGTGDVRVSGQGVEIISSEDGKIVFEVTQGAILKLDIEETDPNGTGDYVRDITVVREEYVDLHEAGAVFNPEWLELVGDARELRVMRWMETNQVARDAETAEWEDRPQVSDVTWTSGGVPLEVLVQLANETGSDPSFTINHNWSDDYIREFATYVRDNLEPGLKAKYEYSNEIWNGLFEQHHMAGDLSEQEWGERDVFGYSTKLAVNMAQILDEVYGDQADTSLVKVLGGFTPNSWISERLLDGSLWAEHEPDVAIGAGEVFDELSVTHYFGTKLLKSDEIRAELQSAIEDPAVDAFAWLAEKLMDPAQESSLPQTLDELRAQKAIADKYGVKLTLYEGGQHVHHQFGISTVDPVLSDFLTEFVRSPEMADLYQQLWDGWAEIGDGAFMQFTATGGISRWGNWGLYNSTDDSTPRSELLEQLNAETSAWWDDARAPGTFQQGVVRQGTEWRDELIGTREEDYLLGRDGDDRLVGGAGDDGLHGGAGYDTALLNGTVDDYQIVAEDGGYRLTGPDGSDYLVDVEALEFADGTMISVADFLAARPASETPVGPAPSVIIPTPEPVEETPPSFSDNILYVGHSLVGDVPQMLQDIVSDAGGSGTLAAQIQLGAPLRWNWQESQRAQVDARQVLPEGETDVLVITEAVPLDPHLAFSQSGLYASNFYNLAVESNPGTQVYLYETWHSVWSGTDRAGEIRYPTGDGSADLVPWRDRLDQDLSKWEGIVDEVNAQRAPGAPEMLLIPAGQAMGRLADAIEAGTVPGLTSIEDVFADDIHLNDLGQYFVSMVQYATIYGQDPAGLDAQLQGRWNVDFDAPSEALAAVFQDIAWETVTEYQGGEVSPGGGNNEEPAPDPNADPDAVFDRVSIESGQNVQIAVLDNDLDRDGDPLTVTSVGAAVNGTATISGSEILYVSDPGFVGTDGFSYTVSDGQGGTDTAFVSIDVTAPAPDPNADPDAVFDRVSIESGQSVQIAVLDNDTDDEGGQLTVTAVGAAGNGTATIVGDEILYEPAPGFSGTDRFSYTISDEEGGTDTAWVSVDVTAPTPDPLPQPDPDPQPDPSGDDAFFYHNTGRRLDGTGEETLLTPAAAATGIHVQAIGIWSTLGQEIGLPSDHSTPAYVTYNLGASATIDGSFVEASYWSTQENQIWQYGTQLAENALTAALNFGSVATNIAAIEGTNLADTFRGNGAVDHFYGRDGRDYLSGHGNDDILNGGLGDDQIFGGNGWDIAEFSGNRSDYSIDAEGAGFRVVGADGSDYIHGIEELRFGNGDSLLIEELALVTEGDDNISVSVEGEYINALGGFNTVTITEDGLAPEDPSLNFGVDILTVGRSTDLGLELGVQTDGPSTYVLKDRNIREVDLDGVTVKPNFWSMLNNQVNANSPEIGDTAFETALRLGSIISNVDVIEGTSLNDRFFGSASAEYFKGGAGNDLFEARNGDDVLVGGDGKDRFFGGGGDDTFWGGADGDTFVFQTDDDIDTIMDFQFADKVKLKVTTVQNLADIEANASDTADGNLFVDLGGGDGLIFVGYSKDQLADITFVF